MEPTSPNDLWSPARLIPVVGIRGEEEQEKRATSTLLSVMAAVPEFGHSLLAPLGAPKGRLSSYAEIQLHDAEGKVSIPDGAIVSERGQHRWRALVEVKTGQSPLTQEQVERYLSIAKDYQFDCVITISNQITAAIDQCPVPVDLRKFKSIPLFHLPWWRIITVAVMQHRHRGIADPERAWILGELITYLTHPSAGTHGFKDMGAEWVKVRDRSRQGTLRPNDSETKEVATRWDQLLDFLALDLSQDLGRDVQPARARGQTQPERLAEMANELGTSSLLPGALKVPDAVGSLDLLADLKARQLMTSVTVPAPKEGRPLTRISWLLRQVKDVPFDLRVEVSFANSPETTSLLVSEAVASPARLLHPLNPKRPPRSFTLVRTLPLGLKGGGGQGSFIRETRRQVSSFYADVMQNLKTWQPKSQKPSQPRTTVEQHLSGRSDDLRSLFWAVDSYLTALPGAARKSRERYVDYLLQGRSFATIEMQADRIDICVSLERGQVQMWDDNTMRDVSGMSHAGSGDVCFSLMSREQLPRLLPFIDQSYEKELAQSIASQGQAEEAHPSRPDEYATPT
jgi:predicted transport protein